MAARVLPQAAREQALAQQRLVVATLGLTRREWARMGTEFDASWAKVGPRIALLTASAQLGAARNGAASVPAILAELGQSVSPLAEVDPRAFAGVASDGRPLESLLQEAVIATKVAKQTVISEGQGITVTYSKVSDQAALAIGGKWLDMAIHTAVADASRGAAGAAIAARPRIGWIRMVNPPCCKRCATLSGKWFRYNQGFDRHPRCFPAGVVVSGPAARAATRRWYEGELTIITTANGQRLPVTGNHPILTARGWVPANLVNEGDDVVRSLGSEGAVPLVVPNEYQVPSRIEDLWRPDRMMTLRKVPTTAEDFHGDGGHGEVDVVLSDGLLRDRAESALLQQVEHELFARRIDRPLGLTTDSAFQQELNRLLHASNGIVRCRSLVGTLALSHLGGASLSGAGHAADLDAVVLKSLSDDLTGYAEAEAEAVLTLAAEVRGRDFSDRQQDVSPRWDAPAGPMTMESRGAYASRGEDLRLRLTSQVELDRVVQVERVQWSGHVFNLSTSEGWYSANGLIVSNCDCYHIPAREDTGELGFAPDDLIKDGKVTGITKVEKQAIADGGDAIAILNAKRVIYDRATGKYVKTYNKMWTTEGTTRRGYASYIKRELDKQRGVITKETATKVGKRGYIKNYTVRRVSPRPSIEAIYKYSDSREEAIKLMAQNGYFVGGSIRDVAAKAL